MNEPVVKLTAPVEASAGGGVNPTIILAKPRCHPVKELLPLGLTLLEDLIEVPLAEAFRGLLAI